MILMITKAWSMFLEVKLTDGLGNQMFQYATGRSICVKNRIPYFLLNIDHFRNNSLGRQFGLSNFSVKGKVITSSLVQKLLRKDTKLNGLMARLPFYKVIKEDVLALQGISEKTSLFTALSGYWQSEYYFKDIRPLLLKELRPLYLPTLPEWTTENNTVAVHVRRTDYLQESGIGCLNGSYYDQSIRVMREKLGDPLFIFFSDDIEWCRDTFRDGRLIFCQEAPWDKDYLQLYLISKCAHQIIANSSFSWWGAWLNTNPFKLVIRPERPFLDNSLQYESYYPPDWIGLKN